MIARFRRAVVLALVATLVVGAGCGGKRKKRAQGDAAAEGLTGGVLVFSDDFNRDKPGENWTCRSGKWDIRDGWLHVQGDKNEGCWLNPTLPDRVRVEFDARASTDEGDLKFEIFSTEQRHQTGYIVILGGWRNTVSIIARLNEHGEDRLEAGAQAVKGKVHHFTVLRTDSAVRWYVDGQPVLTFQDEDPIRGRYFGFNDWAADVSFDNLRIYQL